MQSFATSIPAELRYMLQAMPCAAQLATPDLGARMQSALHSVLEQDGIDKVIHIEANALATIIPISCRSRW